MVAAASVNNSINQDHDDQNLDPSLTALSQASVEFARQEDSQPHRLSQQQHQNSFDDEFLAPTNPDIHRQTVALQHHDASGTAAHLSQPVQDTNASNTASGNDSIYQFFPDFSNTGDFGSHSTNLEYAVLSSMLQNSGYNSSNNNHSNNTGSASMNGNGLFNTTSPNNSSNNNMALSPANMGLINSPLNLFPSIQTGYGDGSNLNNSDTPTSTTSSTGWPSNVMPSNGNASSSSVGGTNKSNHDANDAPRPSLTNSLSHGGVSGFSQSFGFPPAAFSSSDTKTSMGQHRKTSTSAGNSTQSNRNGGMPSPSYTPGPHHSQQQHQPSLSPYHSSSLSLPGNHSGNSNNARNGGFTGNPIDHDWPQISSTRPTPAHLNQDGMSYAQQQQLMLQQHNLSTASKPVYSSTGVLKVEDVYRTVNKPYNYLEAYHALIRYLQANFSNKSDILRIIRAIAIYRPSLIALQMPLTLEDEIFVERSFQRTLIELEKLISFSGTPTLVWRRTGEIMLVGTEFLLLSEWKKNDLLSQNNCFFQSNKNAKELKGLKRKYVFEIFDQQSVVEYYESFAAHAFESSSSVSGLRRSIRQDVAVVQLDRCRSSWPRRKDFTHTEIIPSLSRASVFRRSCRPAISSPQRVAKSLAPSLTTSSATSLAFRVWSSANSW